MNKKRIITIDGTQYTTMTAAVNATGTCAETVLRRCGSLKWPTWGITGRTSELNELKQQQRYELYVKRNSGWVKIRGRKVTNDITEETHENI